MGKKSSGEVVSEHVLQGEGCPLGEGCPPCERFPAVLGEGCPPCEGRPEVPSRTLSGTKRHDTKCQWCNGVARVSCTHCRGQSGQSGQSGPCSSLGSFRKERSC